MEIEIYVRELSVSFNIILYHSLWYTHEVTCTSLHKSAEKLHLGMTFAARADLEPLEGWIFLGHGWWVCHWIPMPEAHDLQGPSYLNWSIPICLPTWAPGFRSQRGLKLYPQSNVWNWPLAISYTPEIQLGPFLHPFQSNIEFERSFSYVFHSHFAGF